MEIESTGVVTPKCLACGESSIVMVLERDLRRWQAGALVQEAFPEMPADQREVLITGTHPECWDNMFGGE